MRRRKLPEKKLTATTKTDFFKKIIKRTWKIYREKEVFFLSASISFFSFFLIIPVLLLLIALAGILGSYLPAFGVDLKSFLTVLLGKYGGQGYAFAESIIKKRFSYGIVGILILFLNLSIALSPLSWALSKIFGIKSKKALWKRGVAAFTIIFILIIIASIATISASQLNLLVALLARFGSFEFIFPHINLINLVFSLAIFFVVWLTVFFLFQWMTPYRPSVKNSLIASFVCSALIETGRQIYLFYMKTFPVFDFFYGTFSFFFVSLMLIYYTSMIFFAGAALLVALEEYTK